MTGAELLMSLEMGLIYGIVALGVYLTFRILDFPDLSCDGSFTTGAASCAVALKAGCNPWLALISGIVAGALSGLLTGSLHVFGRISNLLSGILTAFILYSINLRIMGGLPNIAILSEPTIFKNLPPWIILMSIAVITIVVFSFILATDWGLGLRCIGRNPNLARSGGIKIGRYTLVALMLSNGLVGLGGAIFCQHQRFADASQGFGTVVIALAAIIIGERLFSQKNLWIALSSCMIGSIVYRIIIAFALHGNVLGLQAADLNLVTGIVVVLIMMQRKATHSLPSTSSRS